MIKFKEGLSNAIAYDAHMQSKLNPLASDIIKSCSSSNGLVNPFLFRNNFSLMVNTGAKGSTVNQSQISCALGQQVLEGRRVQQPEFRRTCNTIN